MNGLNEWLAVAPETKRFVQRYRQSGERGACRAFFLLYRLTFTSQLSTGNCLWASSVGP